MGVICPVATEYMFYPRPTLFHVVMHFFGSGERPLVGKAKRPSAKHTVSHEFHWVGQNNKTPPEEARSLLFREPCRVWTAAGWRRAGSLIRRNFRGFVQKKVLCALFADDGELRAPAAVTPVSGSYFVSSCVVLCFFLKTGGTEERRGGAGVCIARLLLSFPDPQPVNNAHRQPKGDD